MSWNIDGILSKLSDRDFISYISSFDFVCLVETWTTENFTCDQFSTHECFLLPAKKLSIQGRGSGGVMLLVKKCFSRFIRNIDINYENIIVIEISKLLFGTDTEMYLICTYLPPVDSPFYEVSDFNNGISILEHCLLDILEKFGEVAVIICGDLNARTSNENPVYTDLAADSLTQGSTCPTSTRQSQDQTLNDYGKLLLEFCSVFDLSILNGNCNGDENGHLTYISQSGCSVIDYFILSSNVMYLPRKLIVDERLESQHLPLVCTLYSGLHGKVEPDKSPEVIEKIIWNPELKHTFLSNLQSPEFLEKLDRARTMIHTNVNTAVDLFTAGLKFAANDMKKRIQLSRRDRRNEWFDSECYAAKKAARRALFMFRQTRTEENLRSYVETRKLYRKLISQKKLT